MDNDNLIFWFVVFSASVGLVVGLTRVRSAGPGWAVVCMAILLVAAGGRLWKQNALIYASLGMWLLFVMLPGIIGKAYHRRLLQQHYGAAHRLARIISWLHPFDGWRGQPEIVRAIELAHRGELGAASDFLKRFRGEKSLQGLAAMVNLYRLTQQWEQLIAWQTGQGEDLECYPQLLPSLLRARGEIGDLRGLTELFERHKAQIAKLAQAETRDQCRLMLFAFCGRRQLVERLFAGSLAMMPAPIREFWLATTDLAAGATESAKSRLEQLLPAADPPMRLAIERRLTRSLVPMEALSESAERLIENAAVEHGHDENFGEGRPLIRKHARATQMLIALNVLMFAAEMHLGGSTDMDALYRLGALYGPAVHGGEWWRLVASLFLHYGPIHLGMNMLALWWLGPFMEFALGWGKFLLVYFITGIGSMGVVMGYASRPDGDQMTVGASGCVMGLIGGTGALMLRAWLRDRAPAAKRRLFSIFVIVATQSAFDLIIPQISMTAHLSGVVIGFAATLALRDRLRIVPPFRPVGGRT